MFGKVCQKTSECLARDCYLSSFQYFRVARSVFMVLFTKYKRHKEDHAADDPTPNPKLVCENQQ